MANPVLGKSLCSDWFFLGQDFAVRTVSMETVQSVYFCFGAKPANSTFATKTAKKKYENCHSSHWNYQQKLKRLKCFRNFKDGWRRRTFFKCKPPEVHFSIRNRVPYNKRGILALGRFCTDLAALGPYCHDLGPIIPVRLSLSVSKRLLLYDNLRERAVCSEFCVLIGYPSGQDGAILPARDCPFRSRK